MHDAIRAKLAFYHTHNRIPNMLFHGVSGSGKTTLVREFIHRIYNGDRDTMARYVMYVNCAYGKGIKFIRDSIKYFAKTNINLCGLFKSIVLINAEKLTYDAQSALRRCIEQFSFNTRFFLITSDRYKLLKPILSRFSEVYVAFPTNLHVQRVEAVFGKPDYRTLKLKTMLAADIPLLQLVNDLYTHAFSAADIARFVDASTMDAVPKYAWLMYYAGIQGDFRNERMILYIMLHRYFSIYSAATGDV